MNVRSAQPHKPRLYLSLFNIKHSNAYAQVHRAMTTRKKIIFPNFISEKQVYHSWAETRFDNARDHGRHSFQSSISSTSFDSLWYNRKIENVRFLQSSKRLETTISRRKQLVTCLISAATNYRNHIHLSNYTNSVKVLLIIHMTFECVKIKFIEVIANKLCSITSRNVTKARVDR